MRHLMSPLDFSVEELDKLMDLAGDIEANPENTPMRAKGRNWQRSSTSQAPGQGSAMRQPC